MNYRRILGIILAVAGGAMLLFSNYIAEQVQEGRAKIAKAQRQVDTGKTLFSLTPVTQEVGKGITHSAQKKIDAGSQEAADYERLSHQLQIGGIIFIIVGIGIIFLGGKKRR